MEIQEDDAVFVVMMGTVLLALMTVFVFAFVQLYKRRQLIYQNEMRQREQDFAEALLRSRLEINESTLRNLSEELHDNIGQAMVGAMMQLSAVHGGNFAEQADTAKQILARALQDLRDLSKTLNGSYILEEGLQVAVEREVALLQNLRKLNSSLSGDKLDRVFSPDVEVVLFRCIQECLSNALKHANARNIAIRVKLEPTFARIEIADDGKGMPPEHERPKGLGMGNLAHRMDLIDGEFSIHSQINGGTRIDLELPLNQI